MDSDDDFLIADHEDSDNDLSDEAEKGTKSPPPTPARTDAHQHLTSSSSELTAIPLSPAPSTNAAAHTQPQLDPQTAQNPQTASNSLPAPGESAPALVVAPKPLSTPSAPSTAHTEAAAPQSAQTTYVLVFPAPQPLHTLQTSNKSSMRFIDRLFYVIIVLMS